MTKSCKKGILSLFIIGNRTYIFLEKFENRNSREYCAYIQANFRLTKQSCTHYVRGVPFYKIWHKLFSFCQKNSLWALIRALKSDNRIFVPNQEKRIITETIFAVQSQAISANADQTVQD